MSDWKTTVLGVLAAGATVGRHFVKPEYQPVFDTALAGFLAAFGWQAADKK
jgi:threonine/homoserine/homoserine lactone efflux protein